MKDRHTRWGVRILFILLALLLALGIRYGAAAWETDKASVAAAEQQQAEQDWATLMAVAEVKHDLRERAEAERKLRADLETERNKLNQGIAEAKTIRLNARAARAVPVARSGGGVGHAPSNPSGNVALGQELAAAKGWTGAQWDCLYQLWDEESGWDEYADNPNSSAYGIPQALPGSKMASYGSDWATNPRTQILWGMDYVEGRYGTPCSALAHKHSHGWY